jgi:hypothetical protein
MRSAIPEKWSMLPDFSACIHEVYFGAIIHGMKHGRDVLDSGSNGHRGDRDPDIGGRLENVTAAAEGMKFS